MDDPRGWAGSGRGRSGTGWPACAPPGQRRPAAARLVLLEDRAQPAQALAEAPPRPGAAGEELQQAVRRQLRLGGDGEAHARGAVAGRVELPDRARPDPVVLARAAGRDDPPRALDLDEGQLAPREALQRREEAEPRPGAQAQRVLAGQVPVDHEVVEELRVVRDVLEVGEHGLARAGDGDVQLDRVHGAAESSPPVRPGGRAARRGPRPGGGRGASGRAGDRPHGHAVLGVLDALGPHRPGCAAAGGTGRRRAPRARSGARARR